MRLTADPILLEDLGEVGDSKSDAHERLRMVRTWTERQLDGAEVIQVISSKRPTRKKKRKKKPWSETVAIAEGDPALPPPNWEGGLLAWAETVHAARRKVDRSRKAMLAALKEAAG